MDDPILDELIGDDLESSLYDELFGLLDRDDPELQPVLATYSVREQIERVQARYPGDADIVGLCHMLDVFLSFTGDMLDVIGALRTELDAMNPDPTDAATERTH